MSVESPKENYKTVTYVHALARHPCPHPVPGGLRYGIAPIVGLCYHALVRHSQKDSRLDRVTYELRASGLKPENLSTLRSGTHSRGYLPHVKREGSLYFVTFRLADSLPISVLTRLVAEKAERLRKLSSNATTDDLTVIERDYVREIERHLDRGGGQCELRRPDIAECVANAIRYFEGERYQIRAWVIMPNHVHVVLWPAPNHTLSDVLKSWKQFTSVKANRILGRIGERFWQPESYDHWIRNDEECLRCCRYVQNNPVKAGLCRLPEEWRWSSAYAGTAKK